MHTEIYIYKCLAFVVQCIYAPCIPTFEEFAKGACALEDLAFIKICSASIVVVCSVNFQSYLIALHELNLQ